PPFHHCPGLPNLRDVGGYPLTVPTSPTTHSVTRGLLYRSADPSRITPQSLSLLRDTLGIRTVFDLRSVPEIQRDSEEVKRQKGVERVWTPVFREEDYSPEKVGVRYKAYTRGAEGFREAYRDILAAAGEAYAVGFRHLARGTGGRGQGGGQGATLVHCTAGKDRTGLLVAVLFGLLGVEKGRICEEYALTDRGLGLMKPVFKERLLRNEALRGDEEGVESLIGSRAENMRVTLELVDEVYGGAEGYLRKVVGLTDGEIEGLRRN
ncbi:tyrosine protein phosphatase 5, partial [Elsinoe ampelina]